MLIQNFFQLEFLNWYIHDSKTSKIFWLHYIKVQVLSEDHKIWKKNPPFLKLLSDVETKLEIFSTFCRFLRIAEISLEKLKKATC